MTDENAKVDAGGMDDVLTLLKWQVEELKNRLVKMKRARDEAVYHKEIYEWAVRGVGHSNVRLEISGDTIRPGEALEIARILGDRAANSLIHEAKLAFDAHAELFEARAHIHYLENHAASRGLCFTPFKEKQLRGNIAIPDEAFWPKFYCRYTGPEDDRT